MDNYTNKQTVRKSFQKSEMGQEIFPDRAINYSRIPGYSQGSDSTPCHTPDESADANDHCNRT